MFNRVLTLFNKPKNNIRIIPKMSAEQEPPVKKQNQTTISDKMKTILVWKKRTLT